MNKLLSITISLCLLMSVFAPMLYAGEIPTKAGPEGFEETSYLIQKETSGEPKVGTTEEESDETTKEPPEETTEELSEETSESLSEEASQTAPEETTTAVSPENCSHIFESWNVIKVPTYVEEGEKTCECPVCGYVKTAAISRLTHLSADKCPDGDVNMDGYVSAYDARFVLRLAVGFDDGLDNEQRDRADFDKKDGPTASDARCVLRISVGIDPYLPSLKEGYTFKGYTSKGYTIAEKDNITYIVSPYGYTLIANKTYSLPSSFAPGDLTAECKAAFSSLKAAAAKDGVNVFILSGYRSYSTQAGLYNRYCAKDGKALADTYSARPGHSEHQSGLAIDVNSLSQSFENTKEGRWLAANAHKYGFIIRYGKDKQSLTGYSYEPWHIRYVGSELASAVYGSGLCLEEFFGITSVYG